MSASQRRFSHWVEFVGDLLSHPATSVFPHRLLAQELSATFDTQVSWNWAEKPTAVSVYS